MRRWRRAAREPAGEWAELDPFLVTMIARLEAARADDEWVGIDQVAALTARMAEAAQAALVKGWDEDAERRNIVERRHGPSGVEVRLTGLARELLQPSQH
jgi:hypothetical protein